LRLSITSKVLACIYASGEMLPSQFYLAFARRPDGEERVGCGEGEEPAKTGPKTIRWDD